MQVPVEARGVLSLRLELYAAVRCLAWVLGTELCKAHMLLTPEPSL